MKSKPSCDIEEDIAFYSMLIKTVPLVSAAVSAAVLPLALYDTVTATALVVYGCASVASVLFVLHLRRRARRALENAQSNKAFARSCSEQVDINAMERVDRMLRILDGWEKGEIPEKDWHIMTGGKPLPGRSKNAKVV